MIVMKVLVYGIFILMISGDASLCGLNDSQKDDLYGSLISVVRKLGEKETVSYQDTSTVLLEVLQKTMRPSKEIMVMKLGIRKGKGFWSFVEL